MKRIFLLLFILMSIETFGQCWEKLDSSNSHTLLIKTDGTLWGWGSNNFGALGNGTSTSTTPNGTFNPIQIGNDSNWQNIQVGEYFSIGIKNDGTLWGWGRNSSGQLGDGTNIDKIIPTQIGNSNNWVSISAGQTYTLAIKNDGTLWAWGGNYYGQLGIGNHTSTNIPTQVGTANDWSEVTAGNNFTVALKNNGSLWSWGNNYYGGLGNGEQPSSLNNHIIPSQIGNSNDYQHVESTQTGDFTLAIKTNGSLWSWGYNTYGECGVGNYSTVLEPTPVNTNKTWISIALGTFYALGVASDGTLWSWGNICVGCLSPIQIESSTNFSKVFSGQNTKFTIKNDNSLWIWGRIPNGTLYGLNLGSPTSTECPTSLNVNDYLILNKNTFSIYPNPVVDRFRISNNVSLKQAKIYDCRGMIIKVINSNFEEEIDALFLNKGIYLLQIVDVDNKIHSIKFLKE